MPQNGDIVKLGTLKVNNVLYAMPKNPTDGGDCVNYSGTAISIEDTVEGKELQWVYVEHGDKKLLICDRCLVVNNSWNNFNSANLIFGKEIQIDGQKYKIRSMTGGVSDTDENNEWSQIIELDVYDIGNSNSIWHWQNMYTWCQDTASSNSSYRAVRGYSSAANWYDYTAANDVTYIGWRPALEILNTAPLISDGDRDLGSKSAPVIVEYSVAEGDGEFFSISEFINDELIRTLDNQTSGTEYTIDLTSRWGDFINNQQYTIKIVATDPQNSSSTRLITFTKANSVPRPPTITSHINGMRVATSFYVEFRPGIDDEDDAQTLKLQVASDLLFTTDVVEFTAVQKKVGDNWVDVTTINNADTTSTFRIQATNVPINTIRYIRVCTTDLEGSGLTTYSATHRLAIGDVLEFQTNPYATDYMPTKISLHDEKVVDSKSSIQVYVTNNALDEAPTWEDASSAYASRSLFVFTNTTKISEQWAVAVKYVITAQDATGEISVTAIGMGVS